MYTIDFTYSVQLSRIRSAEPVPRRLRTPSGFHDALYCMSQNHLERSFIIELNGAEALWLCPSDAPHPS